MANYKHNFKFFSKFCVVLEPLPRSIQIKNSENKILFNDHFHLGKKLTFSFCLGSR